MAEIDVSDAAADWLREAEPDVRDRIMKKLRSIEDFPAHYLKRLSGSPYYRLRVGDYRVVIDWQREESPEILFVRSSCRHIGRIVVVLWNDWNAVKRADWTV